MNLGLIVEGSKDVATYHHWIRKIRSDISTLQTRQCTRKVKTKFIGFLKEFALNPAWQVQKAIVIADSDCNRPDTIEDSLTNRLEGSMPHFPVHIIAIRCKLETWLLADQNAINEVAQRRGKPHQLGRIEGSLEAKDADRRFRLALTTVGLPADDTVYSQVAELSNIDVIRQRCPQFRQFEQIVRAC